MSEPSPAPPDTLPPSAALAWQHLRERTAELRDLDGIVAVLEWDQETMMPPGGAEARARQLALLASRRHARLSDPRVGEWLDALAAAAPSLDDVQDAALRWVGRDWRRAVKIPASLVRELAEARSLGFHSWLEARRPGGPGFAHFAGPLRRLVALTRQTTGCIDPHRTAYDVLLDDYEPGQTAASLEPLFVRLRRGLEELLQGIAARPRLPDPSWTGRTFAIAAQRALSARVLPLLGFDGSRGRLDEAAHPFSCAVWPSDVRLTTRYRDTDFLEALSSTIHECGHGMYEQGFATRLWGTPAAEAPSFGMHESQSRFWENTIARSRPFLAFCLPLFREAFPGTLDGTDPDELYRQANRVQPGLIRVEADEVTYNLHIAIRVELELALFGGDLPIDDLPAAWNAAYQRTLGLKPDSDQRGVLQDVHWAHGAFGYFASYTIGNLYAASLERRLEQDLPDLWEQVGRGALGGVLHWLREHVHQRGRLSTAPELMRQVVGDRDPVEDLLARLWGRHGALYGLARPPLPTGAESA